MKRQPLHLAASCGALLFLASPSAAQVAIPIYTIDGGGGRSTGGAVVLSATIGQFDSGAMSGGTFTLGGGFWGGGGAPATDVGPVHDVGSASPLVFQLHPAAPNPLVGRATIAFELPEARTTRLRIYDVSGRLVRSLFDGVAAPGRHAEVWDGNDAGGRKVSTGVYFVRLESGVDVARSRIAVLR
jgi:hypothetical protein